MKPHYLLLCTIILSLFLASCQQQVVCNPPYILVGSSCCLDKNENNICDNDESSVEEIFENSTLSANEIYELTENSMYLLEVTCSYENTYKDFSIELRKTESQYDFQYDFIIKPKNNLIKINDEYVFSGSAFLFNQQLYTNHHVIDCDSKEVEEFYQYYFLTLLDYYSADYILEESYIEEFIEFNIKGTVEWLFEELNYQIEKEEIESFLIVRIAEYLMEEYKVKETDKDILAYHLSDNFHSPTSVSLVSKGSSFPGKDYAIFDINSSQGDLEKTDEISLDIGSDIYVIGFPDLQLDEEDYEDYLTTIKKEPPVITKGIISSEKRTNSGIKYYVIDAAAYYGSSGGPVLNDKGKVVGILTAGLDEGAVINCILPLSEID